MLFFLLANFSLSFIGGLSGLFLSYFLSSYLLQTPASPLSQLEYGTLLGSIFSYLHSLRSPHIWESEVSGEFVDSARDGPKHMLRDLVMCCLGGYCGAMGARLGQLVRDVFIIAFNPLPSSGFMGISGQGWGTQDPN